MVLDGGSWVLWIENGVLGGNREMYRREDRSRTPLCSLRRVTRRITVALVVNGGGVSSNVCAGGAIMSKAAVRLALRISGCLT